MNQWRRRALLRAGLCATTAFPCAASAQDEFSADAGRLVTALNLHPGQTVADIGAVLRGFSPSSTFSPTARRARIPPGAPPASSTA